MTFLFTLTRRYGQANRSSVGAFRAPLLSDRVGRERLGQIGADSDTVNYANSKGESIVCRALSFSLKRFAVATPLIWGIVVSFMTGTIVNILKQASVIEEVTNKTLCDA